MTIMPTRILIVEDDPDIADLVARYLDKAGFTTERAASGREALQAIGARPPEMVVLDLMLPQLDGLEVCRLLRASEATAAIPIIMLTARAEESERIVGLELGADDYLAKPFSPNELVARVRALLRRARDDSPAQVRRFDDLTLDTATREVRRGDRTIALTRREFDLLERLLASPGAVMPRERLIMDAWGFSSSVETNSVDVYVGYLRRKLEEGGEPRLIHTVRGAGYVLRRAAG
jgi:two-component system, OmpR family, response regulator MprA